MGSRHEEGMSCKRKDSVYQDPNLIASLASISHNTIQSFL